jgi:hypothetical protein
MNKRLEEFRKANTDELTVLNFFDELEIPPVTLQADVMEPEQIMKHITDEIGAPRNYGKSNEEIAEENRIIDIKRVD